MELQSLKLFLMSRYGVERVDALFWEIQMIVLRSLLAVQHVMINDKHCFELYGMCMHRTVRCLALLISLVKKLCARLTQYKT